MLVNCRCSDLIASFFCIQENCPKEFGFGFDAFSCLSKKPSKKNWAAWLI